MGSMEKGRLIVAVIPIMIGVYATFLGLGLVGKKPSASPTLGGRLERRRRTLCILGPGAIAFGLYVAFSTPPAPEVHWRRCTTEDGVCSVEFPGRPKKEEQPVGTTKHRGLLLEDEKENALYRLTCTELLESARHKSVEEQLKSARDVLAHLGSRESESSLRLVQEEEISQDGVPGRELEYTAAHDEVIWIRFFLHDNHLYRLLAAATRGKKEAEVRHFLDSVRFHIIEQKAK